MRIHNGHQINFSSADLRLQLRGNPRIQSQQLNNFSSCHEPWAGLADILRGIGRIDNDRLLRRLICDQVGIVIAFPGPCKKSESDRQKSRYCMALNTVQHAHAVGRLHLTYTLELIGYA